MGKHKQRIFLLTAQQWLGFVLLTILIVGTLIIVKRHPAPLPPTATPVSDSAQDQFATYRLQQDSVRKAQYKKKYAKDTIEIRLQDFDPNTVDSATLRHLGFKAWQAKSMINYRNKGGIYRKPEDLKKLYGMTDSMYQILSPYIHIAPLPVDSTKADTTRWDSLPRRYSEKKDTIINLRTADTTLLKLIPGIGSYRAKQIVRYREELGGFVDIRQVLEARGMENIADSILQHFILDSIDIQTLPINHTSVRALSKHPYLRFEQAKAIYEYRRKHIRIDSISQLYGIEGISPETIEQIAPYLNFGTIP